MLEHFLQFLICKAKENRKKYFVLLPFDFAFDFRDEFSALKMITVARIRLSAILFDIL